MPNSRRDIHAALIDAQQTLQNTQRQIAELEAQLAADSATAPLAAAEIETDATRLTAYDQAQTQTDFLLTRLEATHESQSFDAELREEKRWIEAVLDNSFDGIVLVDNDLGIQRTNQAFDKLFHYDGTIDLHKTLLELIHPADVDRVRIIMDTALTEKANKQFEASAYRSDGSAFEVEISVGHIKDNGLVCTIRDITEHKEQERQLRYYASLQENVNDGIISADMNFHIQSWNHGAEVIYGWRAEEVLGKTTEEVMRTRLESGQPRKEAIDAFLQEGRWVGEAIHTHKNGNDIHVLVSLNLIRDARDQPVGLVGVTVDITERKKAENALQTKVEEEHEFQIHLKNLHEVTIELTQIEEIDSFYKRAVELGLERLGFERLALFLYDETQQIAIGTYGTDITGKLTDEHDLRFTPDPKGIELRSLQLAERFAVDNEVPLYTTVDPVGSGWNAAAVLWNGMKAFGWLVADNAISHTPASKAALDILALYALALGASLAQKKVQSTLRESEMRYRLLADNATDVVMRMTAQADYTYVSPSSKAIMGYEAEELIGQNAIAFAHPDDLPTIQQTLETATDPNVTIRLESRYMHKQGHYVWLESLVRPIRSESTGEVQEFIASSRDITERREAEESLRESEEKFRMLVQAAPIAIIITDQTGTITLVNQQAEQIFGYTQAELMGQSIELLVPDRIREQHINHRASYIASPYIRQMRAGLDFNAKRKDGTEFPAEISLSFVKANDSFIVTSFIADIAERRQTEAELDRQRAFLREVIDVSPSMIFVKDYDAKFILVNPMVAKIYSTTVERLLGKSDADFNPSAAEVENFLAADRRVIDSGIPLDIEEPITDSTGVTRWFRTTKVPIVSSDGKSKYVLGVSTDITERRKIEETLRQAVQKEKELGDLKTRFVSMASHEFRTPLATILALTETVITYRRKLSDEQIEQRLLKIQNQVWHLRDIIEDVLQLARIQARRVEFNPVPLDLDSLCRSVVDEFESRPKFVHQIIYRCDDALHEVKLDRRLMRQVISNLVSNAIKYSAQGSTVRLDLGLTDNTLILKVADEGIGIPETDIRYLFEPFHRATNVGTIPGTGLGLVITKESIELHGGTIAVQSEINVGTTFIVSIPITV